MAKVRDFFLATRAAKVLLRPTKSPLLGVGIRSCPAGLVPWAGQAGGAVSDFGRFGAQRHFDTQPRANLHGVQLGQGRIPIPQVGPLMGTRSTLVVRVAKKKFPLLGLFCPRTAYTRGNTTETCPH